MAVHPLWNPYEVPSAEEIDAARVAVSARAPETVEVVPPDPAWSQWYDAVCSRVVAALGEQVVSIAHVGSTSVPGLPAKPVVDVDLLVPDPADEEAWLPQLEAAGFELRVREPEWEEHRCLRGTDPACNLHVFAPDSRESRRHRMFGAWLRTHPADRELYASVKQEVARRGFTDAMLYNNEKAWVIYDLYEKIFAADPQHPHDPHPRPDR
ncbi:GrpB family protein [Nocardioides dongxiaopingii]|uniref:GrpB family protein n=1 Tax=Nocardioides dongxiaopingii TaxID=2576036 RepID=UPI0010C76B59|nr:GrpB family protein [Nocardioides dongxiaopingii]